MTVLVPVLEGKPWHISGNPDLGPLNGANQQVVDHAIFRSTDGRWHLWACIRGTRIGRLFYRWEASSLLQSPWEPCGIVMRADRSAGESIEDWDGEEWIQAPHVIEHDGRWWAFYGGHRTEEGACQICLATSADGRAFERFRDRRGYSRVFVGPGEARDPMVIRIADRFVCYYAGHDPDRRAPGKVYCRTSTDLVHWGEPLAVNWGGSAGKGPWSAECPFVVTFDGAYYLFRTSQYARPAATHVYRSDDPYDFGGDSDRCLAGMLRVAAPEIVSCDGSMFISSVEDLHGGVQLFALAWR